MSNTQPRKKVKEVDSNISNEQILCKILDCIGNAEVSASKLNKAFVLLRKCISDQSFVIEEEDGKIWEKVGRTLLERDKNRVKGD